MKYKEFVFNPKILTHTHKKKKGLKKIIKYILVKILSTSE